MLTAMGRQQLRRWFWYTNVRGREQQWRERQQQRDNNNNVDVSDTSISRAGVGQDGIMKGKAAVVGRRRADRNATGRLLCKQRETFLWFNDRG